jgi:hypothetical protein
LVCCFKYCRYRGGLLSSAKTRLKLSHQGQNTIINRTNLHALRFVVIAIAFGTGFFVDFKNHRTFLDGISRADGFAIAAAYAFFSNNIQRHDRLL